MVPPIDFSKVEEAGARIAKRADEVTAFIRTMEERLGKLGFGVEVNATDNITEGFHTGSESTGKDRSEPATYHLGYRRIGETPQFGFLVDCWTGDGDGRDWTHRWERPLLKCNGVLRLHAMQHLPRLMDRIASAYDELDSAAETAMATVRSAGEPTASAGDDGIEHDASYQSGFAAGGRWVDSERKATVRRVARKFGELIDSTDYESMFDSDDAMGVGYPIFKIVVGETDNGRDGSEGWWSDVSGGMDSSDTVYEPNYVRGFVEGVVEAANARK